MAKRYWSIAGAGGLLVPICDAKKRIVALQVRVDGATNNKYRYVSSRKHEGASPGSPVHVPPIPVADTKTVRLTEGALKADVATKLSGMLTIGLPGVGSWRQGIRVAKELGAETLRVAFDADARTNHMVAGHLARTIEESRKQGIHVELEIWDGKDGKGIDDLLATGKQPTIVTGADIDQTIADITSAAAAANPLPASPTTGGPVVDAVDDPHRLAKLFLADQNTAPQSPDGLSLRFWHGQHWRWTGTRYELFPDEEIEATINAFIRSVFIQHAQQGQAGAGKATATKQVKSALVSNVIQAIGGITLVPGTVEQPSWLDDGSNKRTKNCIALANGILDLDALMAGESNVLFPHTPRWFSPICLPYSFDPSANCPLWLACLDRVFECDQDRIRLLQQWTGYLLERDTTQQKFLVAEGEGANGKSSVFAATIGMLGEANVTNVPLELFGQRFALTPTLGKLANVVFEVGELDRVAEGILKSYTAGDRMLFDRKFLPPIEAVPTARLMIACNNRIRFLDRSGGLWRRMLLLPFLAQIPKAEQVKGMDQTSWWQASGELPGILNWAICGLVDLRASGRFVEPEVCVKGLEDYRTECNPARMFLLETCRDERHQQPNANVSPVLKANLYGRYRYWCDANGRKPLASSEFGKEVFRTFPFVKDGKVWQEGKRWPTYQGIAYVDDGSPDNGNNGTSAIVEAKRRPGRDHTLTATCYCPHKPSKWPKSPDTTDRSTLYCQGCPGCQGSNTWMKSSG